MTFNKTAILAIAAAVVLTASAIGFAYAYSASTSNIQNEAPPAYITIYQDNAAEGAANYVSSFDDNTIVFDHAIGYMKQDDTSHKWALADTTDGASFKQTLDVKDLIVQETGASAEASAKQYLHQSGDTLVINTTAEGGTPIYMLGSETINFDVVNMKAIPSMDLNIVADGLCATYTTTNDNVITTHYGYKYYAQWNSTAGYDKNVVVEIKVTDPTEQSHSEGSCKIAFDALSSVTPAVHQPTDTAFDMAGTLFIWAVPEVSQLVFDGTATVVAPAVLTNSAFTITLEEHSA